MLLAMSQDIRVMIIKLCDRLHNMRTMEAMPEQKRRDKALETMEVYAPIAHRLGMNNIQEELEDRSLAYLDPVGYKEIVNLLAQHGGRGEFIADVSAQIKKHLEENGIPHPTLSSRVKSIYGIYRKMFIHNKEFEEIYDVYALRIIVDTVAECYNALGVIHDMYHPLPNRFKGLYLNPPSRTATSRCTPPCWDMRESRSRCRSAPARCTTPPSTASPPTGSTRRGFRAPTSWRSGLPGCASCSRASGIRRTRSTCYGTSRASCCPRRSLSSPPRETSSACPPARR